jgi:phenylalanine-4-hydroxylase
MSEMAKIRNLHWWTVEYGLIGSIENPKIYGAGLLSSIGESEWCMTDQVKKIPYDISAADMGFDITKPQPQLYVTPDFAHLSLILEEFANTMALRTGGLGGIKKLIAAQALGTIELSTGLQISGVFSKVISNEGKPVYVQTTGETALAYRNKELVGHGINYHAHGFGSPIGRLKGINLAIEDMSPRDLRAYDVYESERVTLAFEGDIHVSGEIITGTRNLQGEIMIIKLKNCTVKHGETVLFKPEWGIYDMAIGKKVVSAFSGPADVNSFNLVSHISANQTIKHQKDDKQLDLEKLYEGIRNIRENKPTNFTLTQIHHKLQSHPEDWLARLELFELAKTLESDLALVLIMELNQLKISRPEVKKLITDGLELI